MKRKLAVGALIIAFAAVAILLLVGSVPRLKLPAMPLQNGYELLASAAAAMQGDPSKIGVGEEKLFLEKNARVFDQVEKALAQKAEAPERYYNGPAFPMAELGSFKKLALLIQLRGKTAQKEGRWRDAGDDYLRMVKMGQQLEAGPLMNYLVGSAIEIMGIKALGELIGHMDEKDLGMMVSGLEKLNSSRIAFEDTLRRENYFMQVNRRGLLQDLLMRVRGDYKKMFQNAESKFRNTVAHVEVATATTAARRFGQVEKRPLKSLDELVPKFLSKGNRDPFTGSALKFKQEGEKILIYSVGANRVDNDGKGDDVTLGYQDRIAETIVLDAIKRI